ncbi:MAG: adenosylcobinamide-GDP ribazoletransferase [Fervidobacterium sp.]|uniref:Adenosylcobinamide-GDP ribazoletransferase n=1 Tax=Fervidobacterium gondwanense DSM 13020 TaxID=1121883 RepID=A0A1M7TAQ6_FERGO|nr:adenosylcobinamide-GDP ribazoletransferase [Fervidobacterium gondwanense]UXF00991.1 cobalamin synthase [Fervidobacterium riparium]SHN67790.1 cobalamin-5'-phosphate synthase [Fervidobacterium gondwanense DSM 13020]
MVFVREFMIALSFISRIPVNMKGYQLDAGDIRKVPKYFSIVGYLIGSIYLSGATLSRLIPNVGGSLLVKVISIAAGFYLFDLFHFDGLLDMFDGFLNQSNAERRLEIMSKGNVGPFAVFYGTLYVIVFYQLFSLVPPYALLFSSVFGRLTMTLLILFSKPAKNKGLGALLYPTSKRNLVGILFTLPLIFLSYVGYVLSLLIAISVAIVVNSISERKIGGVTGDVIGGTCLIAQLFILLAFSIFD